MPMPRGIPEYTHVARILFGSVGTHPLVPFFMLAASTPAAVHHTQAPTPCNPLPQLRCPEPGSTTKLDPSHKRAPHG